MCRLGSLAVEGGQGLLGIGWGVLLFLVCLVLSLGFTKHAEPPVAVIVVLIQVHDLVALSQQLKIG